MKNHLFRKVIQVVVLSSAVVLLAQPGAGHQAQAALALPKLQNGMDGFGGFITQITPCICQDIGMLLTINGPYGGDYLYSFSNPPKIKIGSFFMIGGPVLGAVKGEGSCGTRIWRGCTDKKSGKVITYLGGILQ